MPLVTVFEYVPSGLPIATTSWPTRRRVRVADRGRGQAGRVDLDDREVGQGVDAVDRAGVSRPSLSSTVSESAAGDDVAVREDPAVRVEDHAGADALLGHARSRSGRPRRRRSGRRPGRPSPRRRRPPSDSSIVTGWWTEVGSAFVTGASPARPVEGARRAQRDERAARREHGGEERRGEDRPDARARAAAARPSWTGCATGVGAGSNQCSGVGGVRRRRGPAAAAAQSVRGSGAGEKNELSIGWVSSSWGRRLVGQS